ncbi:MAG: amidase [Gammaproteobacteria bacterium]|nr:amidase [Gammaproteobacteria bacterium]MDP2142392.1 amidase [Gammaproteobacteria bacterium]MDP2348633.1 amidase [Gammaproteobacteria bacterium]
MTFIEKRAPALFLCILLVACQTPAERTLQALDLHEITVQQLQSAMTAGEVSAEDVALHYIQRIERLNPQLKAVLEINPDALDIARAMDAERAAGRVRSALHGVPVLLKDNIDTADRMYTTAGSLALLDAPVPAKDAFLVQRLRDAGAVILGKTNMSEWANFRSTTASSGWSARGGQTRNPYVFERTPCGSSSGSAVAVAANLAMLAIGTETDGSILCPASHNSIVGLKPTLGMISRAGIIPIAHSQDTAGPMTRTVTDAALLMNVLVAADPEDEITTNMRTRTPLDYTRYLIPDGLRGKRIGVMGQDFSRHPELNALMDAQLEVLRQAGAELISVGIRTRNSFGSAETQVLLYEFKNDINNYLYGRGGALQSLEDLIRFNEESAATEMADFGQELFLQAQEKGGLGDTEYLTALGMSKALSQTNLNNALRELDLHALMAPTNSVGWLVDPAGDKTDGYISNASLAAVSGFPSITVPAGYIDDFPIGITFIGGEFSEPTLFTLAYSFEQLTQARRAPPANF